MGKCSREGEGPGDSGSGPVSTGEHRGLGAGVSKVRSLKMDRKVWTETLIEVGMPLLATDTWGLPHSTAVWVSQPPPCLSDHSTLELEETLCDNLVGGDFGKAIFGKVSKLASELRMFL